MLRWQHLQDFQLICNWYFSYLYGAIANCPYKIDTVSFVLETRHGIWTAQLPITPKGPGKKKRTFGAVTLQFVDGAEGRFAGLLLVPDDAPSGGSPLH